MTTRIHPLAVLALVAVGACDFADKSVGKELVPDESESSSGVGAESAEMDGDDDDDDDDDDAGSTDDAAGDDAPSDAGCRLNEILEELNRDNYICGHTPYSEDLQQTHDCVLEWDGEFTALWTSPTEPAMVAIDQLGAAQGGTLHWYEQLDGVVSTWTCSAVVETPDCTVVPGEMCLICVDPGEPTVLCPE